MDEAPGPLIEQGTDALVAGRFGECARLAALAAQADPAGTGPGLLAVAALREQGRAAEAALMGRDVVARRPGHGEARAMLAVVLADLGRDSDAGRQLDLVDLERASLPVCALAAEVVALLRRAPEAKILEGRIAPHAPAPVAFHGSLARHLGLVAHVLGEWSRAADHFEVALAANRAAGAPVLVAHTCRQYSAVLRLRGRGGDWDRAVELLAEAADIYSRLDIATRAEEAETVLRRSLDAGDIEGPGPARDGALRRVAGGWAVSYAGRSAGLDHRAGLDHMARLLAAAGRPVHVVDLAGSPTPGCLRDQLAVECRSRLEDLAGRPASDPVGAALARAESDRVEAELTALEDGGRLAAETGDGTRRLVSIRLRVALEQIDEALPELGRHLRRSIRTGTFCTYEPVQPHRWSIEA